MTSRSTTSQPLSASQVYIVELREKVGDQSDAITVTRASDDPRTLARDGLLELGFPAQQAEELLAQAEGDSAEDLIQAALKGARR